MVYECLQCQKPQVVGATSCPDCGAVFAGPVPDDAEMPIDESLEPQQTVPEPPPIQRAAPPLPDPLLAPSPPSAQWSMPAPSYAPTPIAYRQERKQSQPWLWIGVPVGVIVLGIILFLMFNAGQTPPAAPDITETAPTANIGSPAPPNAPPIVANATSPAGTSSSSGTAAQPAPVGRWVSKGLDFYEFDNDGSGSSGSMNGSKPSQSFSWSVIKNELNLTPTTGGGAQHLPFTYGPDSTSLYIRQAGGQWLALSKVGAGS